MQCLVAVHPAVAVDERIVATQMMESAFEVPDMIRLPDLPVPSDQRPQEPRIFREVFAQPLQDITANARPRSHDRAVNSG